MGKDCSLADIGSGSEVERVIGGQKGKASRRETKSSDTAKQYCVQCNRISVVSIKEFLNEQSCW